MLESNYLVLGSFSSRPIKLHSVSTLYCVNQTILSYTILKNYIKESIKIFVWPIINFLNLELSLYANLYR